MNLQARKVNNIKMEIQYFGGNCVQISTKDANIVIDDNLADLGGSSPSKTGDITIYTIPHGEPVKAPKLLIDQPGEYEVSNVSIQGIAARSHMDEEGQVSATIFKMIADDVRVAVVGHIYPELSEAQLEAIGMVDILIVPVGGGGYTLDPVGALKVIKKIEPKLIIPTYYADNSLNYPVPPIELEKALTELAMEPQETTSKIKLKSQDLTAEGMQLVVLTKN